jgi:glutathione S-transferase
MYTPRSHVHFGKYSAGGGNTEEWRPACGRFPEEFRDAKNDGCFRRTKIANRMTMLLYADRELTSPYAMSVFVALTEKRLPFEVRTLDLAACANNEPDYARTSLTQRVPTLIDGDFALSESSAIAEYLDEAYPDPSIFPADRKMRARARQLQAWLRSDFMPIRQERPTPSIFYRQPVSAALSPAAKISSRKLCAAASELLSRGGENLFGHWSIADVDLTLMLNRLILNGDEVPAGVADYARIQWERPSVQQWVRKERPTLG